MPEHRSRQTEEVLAAQITEGSDESVAACCSTSSAVNGRDESCPAGRVVPVGA